MNQELKDQMKNENKFKYIKELTFHSDIINRNKKY